jgi:uncharacterized membrane protein
MTQDDFLQQLRHELRRLPKQWVDEVVADYREYIGDALAAGRSEAEVIAALGDPVKLARELKAQASFREWESRRSFGNLMRVFVSIAGLGLLQLLLLVPFMFYLLLLTLGYVVSTALTVTGLATVLLLGSHHLLGWPAFSSIPFSFESSSEHAARHAARHADKAVEMDDDDEAQMQAAAPGALLPAAASVASGAQAAAASSPAGAVDPRLASTHIPDFKVAGERFELRPQPGTRVSIVTSGGPITIRNVDGKLKIKSVGDPRDVFTVTGDTWSIKRTDVIALDLKTDSGDKVSVARIGSEPSAMAWDIRDGDSHVSFVEGGPAGGHLAVQSGGDSVEIDRNHVSILSGSDRMLIIGPHGASIGTLLYGFAVLIAGVLGLWLCTWLTRITWRGLVRYVRRQIENITARLDAGQST